MTFKELRQYLFSPDYLFKSSTNWFDRIMSRIDDLVNSKNKSSIYEKIEDYGLYKLTNIYFEDGSCEFNNNFEFLSYVYAVTLEYFHFIDDKTIMLNSLFNNKGSVYYEHLLPIYLDLRDFIDDCRLSDVLILALDYTETMSYCWTDLIGDIGLAFKFWTLKDKIKVYSQIRQPISCIYFIHSDHNLFYIGKTENLVSRFNNHHRLPEINQLKTFGIDIHLTFIDCPVAELNAQEKYWIEKLNPPLNNTPVLSLVS